MSTISSVKRACSILLRADVVPMMWGVHAIGKSSIARQICVDMFGYCKEFKDSDDDTRPINFIDLRLGNFETGDLIGLPVESVMEKLKRTVYAIPEFWPVDGEGILLLDEVNRVNFDVMNVLLSIILDRKVNSYLVPKGWKIIAAGNPPTGKYKVNQFEEAHISRFCHLYVEPTATEWLEYANASDKFNDDLVNYVASNKDNAGKCIFPEDYGKSMANLESVIGVDKNPRGIELLSRAFALYDYRNDLDMTAIITAGLLGSTFTASFIGWLKDNSGVKPLSGKDIVNGFLSNTDGIVDTVKSIVAKSDENMAVLNLTVDNVRMYMLTYFANTSREEYDRHVEKYQTAADAIAAGREFFSYVGQKNNDSVIYSPMLASMVKFITHLPNELTATMLRLPVWNDRAASMFSGDRERMERAKSGITIIVAYYIGCKELNYMKELSQQITERDK